METNFLDDQLFDIYKKLNGKIPKDELKNYIIDYCESYRIGKTFVGTPYSEYRVIIDRIQNNYLLFVKRVRKESDNDAVFFENPSYLDIFLSNQRFNEIYKLGKR